MAERQDLIFVLSAQTGQFTKEFSAARRNLKSFSQELQSSALGTGLSFTAPIVAGGAAAVLATANLDALRRGLDAVTGAAGTTGRQIEQLREIAKAPGIGFEEAVRGSINLQAVGFSANQSQKFIKELGNALASVGRGREDLNEVIRQLGQLASRGKVTADNLKPILERVPQAAAIIRKEFGTIDPEALGKLGISSQKFIDVLITNLEKLPRTTGGLANEFENLKDSINQTLAEVGTNIARPVAAVVGGLSTMLGTVREASRAFGELPTGIQAATIGITGIAASLPVAVGGLGFLVGRFVELQTAIKLAGGAAQVFGTILRAVPYAIIAGEVLFLAQAYLRYDEAATKGKQADEDFAKSLTKTEDVLRARGVNIEALRKKFDIAPVKQNTVEGGFFKGVGREPVPDNVGKLTGQVKEYIQALRDEAVATAPALSAADKFRVSFGQLSASFKQGLISQEQFRTKFAALRDEFSRSGAKAPTIDTKFITSSIQELNDRFNEGKLGVDEYTKALAAIGRTGAGVDPEEFAKKTKEAFGNIGVKDARLELEEFRAGFAFLQATGKLGVGQIQEAFGELRKRELAVQAATEGITGAFGNAANKAKLLQQVLDQAKPEDAFKRIQQRIDTNDVQNVGIGIKLLPESFTKFREELVEFVDGVPVEAFTVRIPIAASAEELAAVSQAVKDFATTTVEQFNLAAAATSGFRKQVDDLLPALLRLPKTADLPIREIISVKDLLGDIGKLRVDAAFSTLDLVPTAELKRQATEAKKAYILIRDASTSTTFDIKRAWLEMIEAQIAAGETLPSKTIDQYRRIKDGIAKQLNPAKKFVLDFRNQVSTILTGLGRDIADALLPDRKTTVQAPLVEGVPDGVVDSFKRLFNELSGQGFTDATVPIRQIVDQIKAAGNESLAAAIAVRHFGNEGPAIARLLRSGAISADQLNKILARSADVFGELGSAANEEVSRVTSILQSLEKALLRTFVETGISAVGRFVKQGLGGLFRELSKIDGFVGKVFGGLAGALGSVAKTATQTAAATVPGIAGGAASAAGGVAGAAGSVAGAAGSNASSAASALAAANPVTAIVTAVSGVVSAISGVISNFQFAAMNKSLDLIEHEVRFSQIHLLHLLENANTYWPYMLENTKATHGVIFTLNDPVNKTLESILGKIGAAIAPVITTAAAPIAALRSVPSQLLEFGQSLQVLPPKPALAAGGTVNGGIHFHGVEDVESITDRIVKSIKGRGVQVRN